MVAIQSSVKVHPLAKKRRWTFIVLTALLLIVSIASLMIGPVRFSLTEIWHGLQIVH